MYKYNKSEILDNGVIQLRTQEVLELADGSQRTGGYHRVVYTPDMDINSIECPKCQALATTVWTPEVVEAYKASIEETLVEGV